MAYSENSDSQNHHPGTDSENTGKPPLEHAPQGSENTTPVGAGRRGAAPTPLPAALSVVLDGYAAALAAAPLSEHTRRTYLSRVRQYLAWLDGREPSPIEGDPLHDPAARDWAVRDYRRHLVRDAQPKRSSRYVNNTLAALDDFYRRRGLGPAAVAREELPRSAPRAIHQRAQLRWLRAAASCSPRDRALAYCAFYAGLRIGDAVALDVEDIALSARKGTVRVYGKGGKVRGIHAHPELRAALDAWQVERASWPDAANERALFIGRRGGRLSTRAAGNVFGHIAERAGLDDQAVTAHVLRHTLATTLVRGGTDLVIVAEILGHASTDTTRRYALPTDADKAAALDLLPVDR